ncbi:MAG: hypothetical protein Q8T08_00275 [Ignavibacteria bacterium]|nr:hypothetical protein [Ignavibacteria bacterium]
MKAKKPKSYILGLKPDAKIREIDKVLKQLERLPRTPEIMRCMTNIQYGKAKLVTELSKLTRTPGKYS